MPNLLYKFIKIENSFDFLVWKAEAENTYYTMIILS